MERTYNVYIDTGLFVLSNLLDKDIEYITTEDIFNSSEIIFNEILSMDEENFKKLKYMVFTNSVYTQVGFERKFKSFIKNMEELNSEGTLKCSLCGSVSVNYSYDATRSVLPGICSNNFFNYSNNLRYSAICPACIALSLYSILGINRTKSGAIYYASDDNKVMKNLVNRAMKNLKNEYTEITVLDEIQSTLECEILNKDYNKAYYIEATLCQNYGQLENTRTYTLTSERLLRLILLKKEGLWDKFKENKFIYNVLYENYYDMKDDIDIFKFFKDLFLEKELTMDKIIIDEIKSIAKKLSNNIDKDLIKELDKISSYNKFQEFIIYNQKNIFSKNGEFLVSQDLYDAIIDPQKWLSVKRRLTVELLYI
ncbi:hypothetical protein [Clostridium thermobutyricum]|uniref:hypothetical protein n=1 Tax=Clostridium thermobutyricum TaxID=29372 RepID=UPI0018AAE14B|nr:hypothetical protein [Clostridium thermobutyricum]